MMQCGHCLQHYETLRQTQYIGRDEDGNWAFAHSICAACGRLNVTFGDASLGNVAGAAQWVIAGGEQRVRPRGMARNAVLPSVPKAYRDLYEEAAGVLDVSPRA